MLLGEAQFWWSPILVKPADEGFTECQDLCQILIFIFLLMGKNEIKLQGVLKMPY